MEAPKSPHQQSEFPPAGFHESRHDIELQSPVTGSFLVDEKNRKFSSTSPSDTPRQSTNRASHVNLGRQTPVRKYSRDWWERSWNVAVAHRVWPRVLYVTFGVLVITIWIATTVSFATEQIRWDRAGEQQFEETISRNAREKNVTGFISLSGALKEFDPVARSLRVEWSGLFQDNFTSPAVPLANGTWPNVFWPLDIYRDVSTVLYDGAYTPPPDNSTNTTVIQDTGPKNYYFRVDNTTAPHIGSVGMHEWDSFETDISFGQAGDVSDVLTQPAFGYPFEQWSGTITFVASFHSPGQDDHVLTNNGNYSGASVIALAGARLNDNSLNWRFSLEFDNPCDTDPKSYEQYIRKATGAPPNEPFNVTQFMEFPYNLETTSIPCHLKIDIVASRPPLVQFAAVMAVIVNWTSTLFIFILTCETIIMRRGFMLSGTDLLGVTFTALFALPSVRLLLPGAPEFGVLIDLVGIIPNVIIISLCITAIAVTKLNRKRHPDQKED